MVNSNNLQFAAKLEDMRRIVNQLPEHVSVLGIQLGYSRPTILIDGPIPSPTQHACLNTENGKFKHITVSNIKLQWQVQNEQ